MRRPGLAFGLTLDCGYEVLGVAGGPPTGRETRLDLTDALPPGPRAQRLASAAGLTIARDGDDYMIAARGLGAHRVSGTGEAIVSAPPASAEQAGWQRLLTGQALPLAAVLQGLEPIHASAVVCGGEAIAFAAPSRAGKSSICAAMVRAGATFLTDDVLALEPHPDGAGLLAHPGPGLVTIEGARATVQRHDLPVPLGALCLIEPGAGGPAVERVPRPDPRSLLGATFNAVVADRARLERHLDVSARMGARPVYRVTLPSETPLEPETADAVASAVLRI